MSTFFFTRRFPLFLRVMEFCLSCFPSSGSFSARALALFFDSTGFSGFPAFFFSTFYVQYFREDLGPWGPNYSSHGGIVGLLVFRFLDGPFQMTPITAVSFL